MKANQPPVLQFFLQNGDIDRLFFPEAGRNGLRRCFVIFRLAATATFGALHAQDAFFAPSTLTAHRDLRLARRRRTLGPRVTWCHARMAAVGAWRWARLRTRRTVALHSNSIVNVRSLKLSSSSVAHQFLIIVFNLLVLF